MVNEKAMEAALAAIKAQGEGKYHNIAKEFNLIHITVMCQSWKGATSARELIFSLKSIRTLANEQERSPC